MPLAIRCRPRASALLRILWLVSTPRPPRPYGASRDARDVAEELRSRLHSMSEPPKERGWRTLLHGDRAR
ncbi:MAG TPA: hypothetical protein VFA64_02625 [Hyphomicrobiaceae bacterium]|nr:hypothetical protein [Hyphomicrobiaceae bacterium]